MTNFKIYQRTLGFSLRRLGIGLLGVLAFCAVTAISYFLSAGNESICVFVTTGGVIVGLVIFGLIVRYLGYLLKAGQIAMITEGVTTDAMPDDVIGAGKQAVRSRFVTANVYFVIAGAISAITSQITRGLTAVTSALGNLGGDSKGKDVLSIITALINMFISIVLTYVNYCCLAWVFYNKDQNAFKSTCDGAVIYFQNWKTLLKNAGKIMGMTLLSLLVIGGILAIIACGITGGIEAGMNPETLAMIISEDADFTLGEGLYVLAVVAALLIWGLLHSVFVEPYILVSALRTYLDAAKGTTIGLDLYEKLCGLSKKFKQLFGRAQEAEA